jgi:hypothetical protein
MSAIDFFDAQSVHAYARIIVRDCIRPVVALKTALPNFTYGH